MNILTKSSYDFLSGQEMKEKDGLIALLFYVYFIFITCVGFILLKDGLLDHYPKELSKIIFGTVMLLMMLIPLFVILKLRNQDITTIGLTRFRLRRSIVISLVLLLTYLVYFIIHYGLSITLFYKLYFYIITVGFFEEIMFRGYIWPRFAALFGVGTGTIISGILFGFAHAPLAIILNDQNIYSALFNNIGFGIIGHIMFGYIFALTRNIIVPSVIHGLLDAL